MTRGHPLLAPVFVGSPHPASIADEELLKACTLTRGRSSGPGGQHRNKVQTHVELTHTVTGLWAQAGERRSAEENKRVALRRLRLELAIACRSPVPLGEIGSDLWRSRVSADGKIAVNVNHHDYPALLALALDVVFAGGLDLSRASVRLRCTRSQLVRLIAKEPRALAALNEAREAKGKNPLRG